MRKVIVMIMARVAAIVMRATVSVRRGYGASSCVRNSRNQLRRDFNPLTLGVTVAMFSVHGSQRRRIHLLETDRLEDLAPGLERDNGRPDVPTSAFFAHPGGRAPNARRHRGQA